MFKASKKLAASLISGVALTALFSAQSFATIGEFSDDFEAMTVSDESTDLAVAGWRIGANISDGVGTYPGGFKFFYGLFDAPNGGPGFSGVATGDATNGGVGVNYLNIYSDYNCCGLEGATPEGHGNGTDVVNALVLKEFLITSDDIGKIVTFTFDAKRPDVVDDGFGGDDSAAVGNGCSGICTANAFVKTLDPGAGFATTNVIVEDTTAISQTVWTTYTMTIDLSDPLLDGQRLQVGFESFSGNFDNTGVYYDNISLTAVSTAANVPFPAFAIAAFAAMLGLVGINAFRKRV